MRPSYAGKKRDANEPDIVNGLTLAGFKVHRLNDPLDLLVWPKAGGRFGLIEVKDPRQAPSARKLTKAQVDFFSLTEGCPRIKAETFTQALEFAYTLRNET
jgi:hypothetical protein